MQYVETPMEDAIENIQSITCPDGKLKCPDETTCCKLPDGRYGCCPYPEAVCCKDRHCCHNAQTCCEPFGCCLYPNGVCCKTFAGCCPYGTQCDEEHTQCLGSHFLPMLMGLSRINNIDSRTKKVNECRECEFILNHHVTIYLHIIIQFSGSKNNYAKRIGEWGSNTMMPFLF